MRRLPAAFLALIFLTGCATSKAAEPPSCGARPAAPKAAPAAPALTQHTILLKVTKDLTYGSFLGRPKPIQGLHSDSGTSHTIQITDDLETDLSHVARIVCAHEMGHALGVDHLQDETCWMYPRCGTNSPIRNWPCLTELATAKRKSNGKVFVLTVDCPGYPAVARAARWAAETWNCAFERDVIVLKR